jgi:hypothetical protein
MAGVVRDRTGAPVAEAVVSLAAGPVPLPDIAALTGPDGSFRVTAPMPGAYQLVCYLPDGERIAATVDIAAGAREVAVQLSPG